MYMLYYCRNSKNGLLTIMLQCALTYFIPTTIPVIVCPGLIYVNDGFVSIKCFKQSNAKYIFLYSPGHWSSCNLVDSFYVLC